MADERCNLDPTCERGQHLASDHPCGGPWIKPGDPCTICGGPTDIDEQGGPVPCPKCWTVVTGLPLADIKALMARADLSVSAAGQSEGSDRSGQA